MEAQPRSAIFDPMANNPFAQPKGLLGRIAGRIMLWTNKQDEVVGLVGVRPGDRVLEVGYGPGGLVRLLAERTDAASIIGVDLSPAMLKAATKHNQAGIRSGRVQLGVGTADRTGLPDDSVDRVVSVNNVEIWPDLDAGLRELHRVVRPGGAVVIAWHGGTSPSPIARRLRLSDDKLRRIENTLRHRFSDVTHAQLTSLDVFTAVRPR